MSRSQLSSPIARYFAGVNARDAGDASSGFARDATVRDEHREHVGRAAIRGWIQDSLDRHGATLLVEDVEEERGATTVAARVSGGFPGSPIELRFHFRIAGGLITHLEIGA